MANKYIIWIYSFPDKGSQGSDDGRLDEDLSRLQGKQLIHDVQG